MVALLAAFALSSCVKEDFGGSDEATMTLSINLPDGAATKAYGDGKFADKNLIIGVFDENGVEKFRKNYVWGPDVFTDEVTIRFVMGKSYQLVLWAQYGDAYGNPADMALDKITLDYKASNREDLDAFYCYVPTFKVTQDFQKSVTLRRPFAQLNFATTVGDISESIAAGDLGIHNKAEVTVKNVANTLDLFTGKTTYEADGKVLTEGAEVVIPATEFPSIKGEYQKITVEEVDYEILSMNYILVADEGAVEGKTTVDLKLQVGELEITVPGANMKRNWRTNVVGELLTAEGSFKVVIDPEFGGAYNENWNDGTGSEDNNEPTVQYSEWKLLGSHNSWASEEFMVLENGLAVAKNVVFPATKAVGDAEFKVSNGTVWYGMTTSATVAADKFFTASKENSSENVLVAPGTYDIWFDAAKAIIYVMTPGKAITEATELKVETPEEPEDPETETWGIVGTVNGWGATADFAMTQVKIGEVAYWFADNFVVETDGKFKFRYIDGNWDDANVIGGGGAAVNQEIEGAKPGADIAPAAGTYDIYLDVENVKYYIMADGKTPADVAVAERVDVEIYVVKAADWTNNYLYSWGAISGTWPGKVANETVTINNVEYYKWTINVAASSLGQDIQVIFNDGNGTQTADSEAFQLAEKQYFQVTADKKVVKIDAPVVETPEEPEPVVPAVALTVVTTEQVPAEGGNVVVKVTSNVAWTLALDGAEVVKGTDAVTDFEVTVPVPANTTTEVVNHTLVLSDVPAEGVQATTATAEFAQAAAQPETPVEPETPALASGAYWIKNGDNYATPLTGNYGYIQVVEGGYTDNVFTFTAVEGGYTIQDPSGKYYYQTGTYNSFNVAADMPAEGAVWTVAKNDDGTYVITNVSVTKSIQYDAQYNSFGSYADVKGIYPVLVDASNATERPAPEVPDTPDTPATGEYSSNVEWVVDANTKSYSEKATINGESDVPVLKLGTSSVVGSATFTIPAGTSKIAFYGVAWNAKTGKVTFTVPGNDPVTFTLKSNTGAANNSPYTMTVTDADFYVMELASPCAAETTVSLATESGATRVILFGIQAE